MAIILAHAQGVVYTLLSLMPTTYQRDSLQALLGMFLEAQGHPLPQHSQAKSATALSRLLNVYPWSTRRLIRTTRQMALKQILSGCPKGRRPRLQVIIDLTTLEKRGLPTYLPPAHAERRLTPFGHCRVVFAGDRIGAF